MIDLQPLDFYALRFPTLPFNRILEINAASKDSLEILNSSLKTIFENKDMQEAIFLASPNVYRQMLKWLEDDSKYSERLLITLYKYLVRNGFRCTPYGLFSGFALGSISDEKTSVNISEQTFDKVSRIDMGYLSGIINEISGFEYFQDLKFYTNTSLYEIGDKFRFYEYKISEGKREYFLSEVEKNPFLERVISVAENGSSVKDIVAILIELDVSENEATNFITQLIKSQILETDLSPKITDNDRLNSLISRLNGSHNPGLIDALRGIRQTLVKIQQTDNDLLSYLSIQEELKKLLPNTKNKDYVQTDLFITPGENNLSTSVVQTILDQLNAVSCLRTSGNNKDLEEFKKKFYARFENQEISLLEALDTDLGLGYGSISGEYTFYLPLIDDLEIPSSKSYDSTEWNPCNELILKLFLDSQKSQTGIIEITDSDLDNVKQQNNSHHRAPFGFYILGTIITNRRGTEDENFMFSLASCGGASALPLLSRFGRKDDLLTTKMREYACLEESLEKDKIIAEIIHLPSDYRIGNILTRPQLHSHEIAFLGNTTASGDKRINARDLYISVRNNRLVLRSKKLGKEIIPRLTSAHNYTNGLPLYKFLCDLQYQDYNFSFGWKWGFLDKETFLPRITYKNLILQRSRWIIRKSDFLDCCASKEISEEVALLCIIEKRKIPEILILAEGDNELFIDLSCLIAQKIVLSKLNKGDVVFFEYIQSSFLSHGDDLYTNEIIIPVQNKNYEPVAADKICSDDFKRKHILGSKWLYVKIYTSNKWADRILENEILPLVKTLKSNKIISSWFFVRYRDPETHVRIRFKTSGGTKFLERIVYDLERNLTRYLENKVVHRVQYDTYNQEVEKYRSDSIELSEGIFFNDSEAVIEILSYLHKSQKEDLNWLVSLKGIDAILNDFNFSLENKINLISELNDRFFREFNGDKKLLLQLNSKYRKHASTIKDVLNETEIGLPSDLDKIILKRTNNNKALANAILKNYRNDDIRQPVANYIHLFVNRMCPANQRLMELTLYHFLKKFYASAMAKSRYKVNVYSNDTRN